MQLPSMKYAERYGKGTQVRFRGLKHRIGAGDGEIWDMQNMTGEHYPVLSTRNKRRKLRTLTDPGGLFCLDGLCWVEQGKFWYKGEEKGQVSPGLKRFAAIGSTIVILPDKCYYNIKTGTFGKLESEWKGATLTFGDGKLYGEDADANMIYYPGISWADYFREGDGVTISGCTLQPGNNQTAIIRQIDGDKLYFYENIFTLQDGEQYTEVGELRIGRDVPDLQYLCENENRLWGCTEDTIYACKLGDIFNWNVFDGLDSDSWSVSPEAAGKNIYFEINNGWYQTAFFFGTGCELTYDVDAEGNFYYINSSKKAVKNCKYAISAAKANGLVEPGEYTFGADGKMVG